MNVGSLRTAAAQQHPQNLATVCAERRNNYQQCNARVNQAANALRRLQVEPRTNVAILMANCPEMLEIMFAAFKAGCGAVPINFRLHPDEFAYIIDNSEASVLFVSDQFVDSIEQVRESMPGVRHIVTVGDQRDGALDYEGLLSPESSDFADFEAEPDDVAWLFYTSGTTGVPKGAMLTHQNLLGMTERFYSDVCPSFGDREVVLHAAPLSHGSGLYGVPNVGRAAAHVFFENSSFDPVTILRSIDEFQVSNFFAAPAMINRLVECPVISSLDLSSLKALVWGGAPMMVDDLQRAIEYFPNMVQIYGLGETPMTITYLSQQDHVCAGDQDQLRRLASAGVRRTNVEVEVVDENDNVMPIGEMGEIVTRSDVMTIGYWRDPEATAKTLRNGWLHTGDLGYFDEGGYLFLMDRSKDMIISGGENIYPREIEEVLVQHESVREVAVIGVPDIEWGEAIKAVVALVPGSSTTADELVEFCRARIASYKKPKSIDFVDELPKNNYGKILKRELREPYWQDQERRI